jgi:hypothetical protein
MLLTYFPGLVEERAAEADAFAIPKTHATSCGHVCGTCGPIFASKGSASNTHNENNFDIHKHKSNGGRNASFLSPSPSILHIKSFRFFSALLSWQRFAGSNNYHSRFHIFETIWRVCKFLKQSCREQRSTTCRQTTKVENATKVTTECDLIANSIPRKSKNGKKNRLPTEKRSL